MDTEVLRLKFQEDTTSEGGCFCYVPFNNINSSKTIIVNI